MGVYTLEARNDSSMILDRWEIKDCFPTTGRFGIWNWEFNSEPHGIRETTGTFFTKWPVELIHAISKVCELQPKVYEEYQRVQTLEVLEWAERTLQMYDIAFFTLRYVRMSYT